MRFDWRRQSGRVFDMDGILILIPIALFMGLVGLLAFLWNLKNKQYDDPKGAAMRILNDDDFPLP